jgi:hypothetical protein
MKLGRFADHPPPSRAEVAKSAFPPACHGVTITFTYGKSRNIIDKIISF